MKSYLEQFLQWWNARLPRERQILIVGAAVVAVFVLYSAIWSPLQKARHRAELDLQETRALANRLEDVAAEVQRDRGVGGGAAATRGMPLLSAVDQAAHRPELGKQYEKIEPDEGERTVKIWIDDVPFDALVNWLSVLQTQYGIVVSSAELERKGEGVVNARLSLMRP
jgi:general secretion pathway protein M